MHNGKKGWTSFNCVSLFGRLRELVTYFKSLTFVVNILVLTLNAIIK